MSNNLVTEYYLAANFTPKSGITPGTDDHQILNCTEILARYNVTISPSTGNYCPKQSELSSSASLPTVSLGSYSDVTFGSITHEGTVTSDGGATVTERGFVYKADAYPSVAPTLENCDGYVVAGSGTGAFAAVISGLSPNTAYAIRPYAKNSAGTAYSSQYNSIRTAQAPSVGDYYNGGVIGYIFQPGDSGYVAGQVHGIIVGTTYVGTKRFDIDNYDYEGTQAAIGEGLHNCELISDPAPSADNAACYCLWVFNGTTAEWFVPSIDELLALYDNRSLIGDFSDVPYWSSSESGHGYAKYIDFATGNFGIDFKTTYLDFRPCKYF